MSSLKEQFVIPKKYNTYSFALMGIGLLSIIILFITHGASKDDHESARFWASILQNSVYFMLVVNAVMFFITATTLAWGGWQLSFRRVSEAISTCVPVMGVITFVILMALIFGGNHTLFHWADPSAEHDKILKYKSGFLNKGFFTVWSIIAIVGWWLLGRKIRSLSRSIDNRQAFCRRRKKIHLEQYRLGGDLHRIVCAYCSFFHSMALDHEHQRTLVFHHVQLVYFCQFLCGRCGADHLICSVPQKPWLPGVHQP
jgi:hypothetical protein